MVKSSGLMASGVYKSGGRDIKLVVSVGYTEIPHCIRNPEKGNDKSSKKSNSLWSISFGNISEHGPAHTP